MEEQTHDTFFHILSFSMFSDVKGPVPVYCYPEALSESTQVEIAMKSVSLLMGEAVYQAGHSDDLKFFGILPFPDLNYIGLTYFFLIPDEQARGKSKAATVTIVVKESHHHFIYDNIHTLRILLDKTRVKLRKHHEIPDIKKTLDALRLDITKIHEEAHETSPHSRLNMVFAGLENSGKSSFLKAIQKDYSDLNDIPPTKGTAQMEKDLLLDINALEWNFGGQGDYRNNYYKNATLYLNDVDLLFYFIDIQNFDRLEESLRYFSEILHTLDNFKNSPLIHIALHKYDPDLEKTESLDKKISYVQSTLLKLHSKWDLKIFQTSIFDKSSINECFSYGFSRLSPNGSKFANHIEKFVKKLNGHVGVLLTHNALILGEYSSGSDWHELVGNIRTDMLEIFRNGEKSYQISHPYHSLQLNGVHLVFYRISIGSHEFFLLFDSDKEKKKIEKSVNQFKKKITPLIQSYLD